MRSADLSDPRRMAVASRSPSEVRRALRNSLFACQRPAAKGKFWMLSFDLDNDEPVE